MAKKKKMVPRMFFSMCNDQVDLSDGVIILRPEIRIVGSFNLDFARLFQAYAWEAFSVFIDRELMRYIPKPDPDPVSSEEVPGNE